MVSAERVPRSPQVPTTGDDELHRLTEDLLAMDLDDRLETLRRYAELRASVTPVAR